MKTILRDTTVAQATSKKETKGVKIARVLLFSAIAQSGMFARMELPEEIDECIETFMKGMLEYFNGDGWIQNMILKVIFDLIEAEKCRPLILEGIFTALCKSLNIKADKKKDLILPSSIGNLSNLLIVFLIKKCSKILGKKCKANLFKEDKLSDIKGFFNSQSPAKNETISYALEVYIDFLLSSKKAKAKIIALWDKVIIPEMAAESQSKVINASFLILSKIFVKGFGITLEIIAQILTPVYVRLWASSMHSPVKSISQTLANLAETNFGDYIDREEKNTGKGTIALQLLKKLFGPNPNKNFTPTRHSKVYKALLAALNDKQLAGYSKYLSKVYDTVDKKSDPVKQQEIQLYAFTQFTNVLAFSNVF